MMDGITDGLDGQNDGHLFDLINNLSVKQGQVFLG